MACGVGACLGCVYPFHAGGKIEYRRVCRDGRCLTGRKYLLKPDPRLSLELAGIKMESPLMAASGCYGYGFDYADWVEPRDWGAIVLQGTTLEPRIGNPPPRLAETPSGCLTLWPAKSGHRLFFE